MFLFWNQFGPCLGTFYKSSVRTIAVIIFADLYDLIFDHMAALIDVILAKLGICCHVSGRIKVVPELKKEIHWRFSQIAKEK